MARGKEGGKMDGEECIYHIPAADPLGQVPIIDLSDSDSGSLRRPAVLGQVRRALETWGMFQAVNHGIPVEILEEMLQKAMGFHQLEEQYKRELYSLNLSKKVRLRTGFSSVGHRPNWKDSLLVDMGPEPPAPEEIPSACREILDEYLKHVKGLGEKLFEIFSEVLGLRRDRLKAVGCAEAMLVSCHYYPPCPGPQPTIGTVQHCDPAFLTVLLQDQVGGLQVLHKGKWWEVTPVQGALVINTGVFLQLLTNDKVQSVVHRVLNNNSRSRISVACLYGSPTSNSIYGPLKEFIEEEGHPVYTPITPKEYFASLLTKVRDFAAPLEDFKLCP